jgi:hypothetical protein
MEPRRAELALGLEERSAAAAFVREAATPESSRAFPEAAVRFDVTNRPAAFAQAPSTSKARADLWPP